jgi:hypothetical protein
MSGVEAISADGQMLQDMSATCIGDSGVTKYRSVNLILPDGGVDATIIYRPDGTVEANCGGPSGRKLQGLSALSPNDNCFGPKYHDDMPFAGNVTYGSLRAERFTTTDSSLDTYIDLDVDHGCIPIFTSPFSITNYDASAPDESLFVIPPECSQQSAKVV